jgi:hypothetical protein
MAQADTNGQRPAPAPTCDQAEPPPFPKIPGLAISWDARRGFWLICGHTNAHPAYRRRFHQGPAPRHGFESTNPVSDGGQFPRGLADGRATEIHLGSVDLGFVNEFFNGELGKIHRFNAHNLPF